MLELKFNISPLEVARKCLGKPSKVVSGNWWYKSPFRQETQPSFIVSKRGFHDFGDNWSGDIIAFIQRFYGISFKEAIEFLKTEYGFTENEYENEKIKKIKKQQTQQRQEKEQEIIDWFNEIYGYLCDMWKLWNELVKKFEPLSFEYAYTQNELFIYDYWTEYFIEHSNEKEKLFESREEIEWKIKYQTNFITN